ncbi:MAG: biopolymer transporter ExbD [Kiritimatiellae bacterium]|nr:biopolymer transporter ExbD [Kiritimatiellia bacterium]
MREIPEDPVNFNMAPMIDMVFQLLIFFMVESHFSTVQNVDLQIPAAEHAVVPKERPDRLVINIQKDGTIFCGNELMPTVDDLKNRVAREIAERKQMGLPEEVKIYVRADRDSEHVHVRKVMNAMSELGVSDFIFGAFKPGEEQTLIE